MRLGIDLDGVIADFNAGWMKLHAEEFGTELRPDMVDSWDCLHRLGGFADVRAFWRWASPKDHRPSIFRHLDPYPDAIASLRSLAEGGHQVVIVTTKPRWARSDTLRWIAEHDLPTDEVHIDDRKSDIDCDVYLDDAPHVLAELLEHRPDAVVCRFVRPWNRPLDGAVDIADWDEFLRLVDRRSDGSLPGE